MPMPPPPVEFIPGFYINPAWVGKAGESFLEDFVLSWHRSNSAASPENANTKSSLWKAILNPTKDRALWAWEGTPKNQADGTLNIKIVMDLKGVSPQ